MSLFSTTVDAKLAGRTIGAALLVFMDFLDNPRRWWPGFGSLVAGGFTWEGTGEYISLSGLDQPIGEAAPKTTFTLSGVSPDLVAKVQVASTQVKNRRVEVYLQFFDITPTSIAISPWTPLDEPYNIWTGRMDQITYMAQGPSMRTISLTAESLWVNRRRPSYGLYTDRDQQARFPGDAGLQQVSNLVTKTIRWPNF